VPGSAQLPRLIQRHTITEQNWHEVMAQWAGADETCSGPFTLIHGKVQGKNRDLAHLPALDARKLQHLCGSQRIFPKKLTGKTF